MRTDFLATLIFIAVVSHPIATASGMHYMESLGVVFSVFVAMFVFLLALSFEDDDT